MNKKDILLRAAGLIFLIFLFNSIANFFYWYTSIWYFDMIMHFLGGLWVGLAFLWIFWGKEINLKFILKIILGVFLIGFFWEIFEIIFNNIIARDAFNTLDTISDLCFDIAGGAFALLYVYRKTMFILKDNI